MNSVIVRDGQSLLDICLQELGDVAAAFELADANGLAITDQLTPGQRLTLPASRLGRPEVAGYFASQQRLNTGDGTPLPPWDPMPGLRDFSPLDYTPQDFN